MEENNFIVGEYLFANSKETQLARKEKENIDLVRSKTDFSNKEALQKVYNMLIDKRIFKTPVGYIFLSEIRYELIVTHKIDESQVPPIYVSPKVGTINDDKVNKKLNEQLAKEKDNKKKYVGVIIILLCTIISMFIITLTNKNVGYINTEKKIIEKYEHWQTSLEEKEEELNQKEQELLEKENMEQ